MRFLRAAWYYFILNLARLAFMLVAGRVRSVGGENVPRKGAVIVAPLHVSHLDPEAVACGTNRRMRFMAKEELFHKKLFGWFIRSLGAFPVKRGEGDTESIRKAIQLLNEGEAVLIFPEGTRGNGEEVQPVSPGIAMIAKRTGAPIMPVGVIGTHKSWPRGQKKIKRAKILVAYGKPFTYEEIASEPNERENRKIFAEELRKRIAQLCTENGMPLRIAQKAEETGMSDAAAPPSADQVTG